MNKQNREDLERTMTQVLFRANEIARHVEILKSTPLFVDWEGAWKYAYHIESDLASLARHVLDANTRLVDLRVDSLGANSLPVDVVGAVTAKLLRSYLGLNGPKYQPIYAALGGPVYAEDSTEALQLVALLHEYLDDATGSGNPPAQQEREVLILSAVLSALAYRADPGPDRQREFLLTLKELMTKTIDKTSTILELLNELERP